MNLTNSPAVQQVNAAAPSQGLPPSRPRFPFVIVLNVWLLAVITTTIVTMLLPESYSSFARIRIERDAPDIAGLAEPSRTAASYDPYFIQTEFEVIQSELILGRVVEDLDLSNEWGRKYGGGPRMKTSDAISLLKGRMDLRPVRNTSLIEIRVYSERPEEAARIANAIARAYQEFRTERRRKLGGEGIAALEDAYRENDKQVREAQAQVAAVSSEQGSQASNRLAEAHRRLEDLQRFGQVLNTRISTERIDLRLPASRMVEIVDKAVPAVRPVRPNKPWNIFLGFVVGGVGGFFLATFVYVLQWRESRRLSGIPRTSFPPRFRALVHVLIALVVGVIVGYNCATPLDWTTIIMVPLSMLLGGGASAYIELASSRPVPPTPSTRAPGSAPLAGRF